MQASCPMCHGHPVCTVRAHFQNLPCDYCGGSGQVDTNRVCLCGKPGVRKVNDVFICMRYECLKETVGDKA